MADQLAPFAGIELRGLEVSLHGVLGRADDA